MALRYAAPFCVHPRFTQHQAAGSPLRSGFRAWPTAKVTAFGGLAGAEKQPKVALVQCETPKRSDQFRTHSCAPRTTVSFRVRARHSHSESGETPNPRRLILYSKQGCCLCDGIKEKLEGIETAAGIHLEVRDITANSEWWNAYQYEIPVLTRLREDGVEVPLPRLSPRLNAEQVQRKVHALMTVAD